MSSLQERRQAFRTVLAGGSALAAFFLGKGAQAQQVTAPPSSGTAAITGGTISGATISGGNASAADVTSTGGVVARSLANHLAAPLNVKDFGAIGNGGSHPASSVYGTLAALRAVYGTTVGGVTIALTNELDWLAHQKVIDTAYTTSGGTMYSPTGKYVYTNSNSVSDGSGTLVFPETGTTDSGNLPLGVNWCGDGFNATLHTWPSDLGAGHFAVTCTNRLNTTTGSVGYWSNMAFVGPNNAVAKGAKPANMHGLGWAEYRIIHELRVTGFNGGYCVNSGGQTQFYEAFAENCYYGMYYDAPNVTGDSGDMTYKNFAAVNCTMAGIGVANNVEISGSLFIKGGVFTTPYGIFKETGGSNSSIGEETTWQSFQFENIGNALVSDGLAAGSHLGFFGPNMSFQNCQYLYNASYAFASNPHTGIICLYTNLGRLLWDSPPFISSIATACVSQTNGIFEIDAPQSLIVLRGDMVALLPAMQGVAPIGTGFFSNYNLHVENTDLAPWSGVAIQANGTPTISVGNILAVTTNNVVQRCAGNTTEQIAGICMLTNNGVSGGPVVVAQSGYVQTVTAGANVISNGSLVRADGSGLAVTSSGQFQTTSKNIGMWQFGSGSSPNLIGQVLLQGLV